jgi:hypothetical protein
MQNRIVEFVGEIPLNQIDLFVKIIHNLCKDSGCKKLHISDNNITVSLLNDHIEAIANEAIIYKKLEDSVKKISK